MQLWHYFALLTVLSGSIADIIIRMIMKKEESDPILFTIVFQFILGIFVLTYSFTQGFSFPPPISLWPRFLLSGILYAAGSLCSFYASKTIPAGEKTILVACGAVISVCLGVFLLGNQFSIGKTIGVALILLSVYVLFGRERFKMSIGVWYALGVALFFAVAIINDIIILRTVNIYSFLPVMCFLPGVVLAIIFPRHLKKIKNLLKPKALLHISVYSLMYSVSAITFYQALNTGASISQLSPITRASIILTVLFGVVFLGERKHLRRKLMSAIIVSIGVLLLA